MGVLQQKKRIRRRILLNLHHQKKKKKKELASMAWRNTCVHGKNCMLATSGACWTLNTSQMLGQKCQLTSREIQRIGLPCSNLKHRERFAASISGLGWSRTRLHHCRGLSDFSWRVRVLVGKTYNLNQNTHKCQQDKQYLKVYFCILSFLLSNNL